MAKGYGEPLQYSVFVCDLTRVELLDLKTALLQELNQREDSVGIFDLGPPAGRGLQCVEFIGTRRPLPGPEEAAIW